MVQSPSWEDNWFAASQEIPRISRNKHTPPVSVLGQPNPDHIPHPTSWRSILILSTLLRLGLPSGLLPSGFPTKNLYTPLSSPIRATCPAHLILLDFITRTILGDEYISFSSSLCSLFHPPVTSSFLGPNILFNALFSNTLSFLSSLNVSDQVSHPYKTIGKNIVLYILNFKFLDSNLEDKRFCTEWYQAFPNLNLLLISSGIEFWCVKSCSQIFKLFHPLEGTIVHPHTLNSSCILISRHDHVLSFISTYFQSNLPSSSYQSFWILLYVSYTNVHSVFEKKFKSQQSQTWCCCECFNLCATNSTWRQTYLNIIVYRNNWDDNNSKR